MGRSETILVLMESQLKFIFMYRGWEKLGLVEVCDVCGEPLLKGQELGKKMSNDALCHDNCLYYKIGKRIVTRDEYEKHLIKKYSKK